MDVICCYMYEDFLKTIISTLSDHQMLMSLDQGSMKHDVVKLSQTTVLEFESYSILQQPNCNRLTSAGSAYRLSNDLMGQIC